MAVGFCTLFSEPTKVKPGRSPGFYRHQATGRHKCPGLDFSERVRRFEATSIFVNYPTSD